MNHLSPSTLPIDCLVELKFDERIPDPKMVNGSSLQGHKITLLLDKFREYNQSLVNLFINRIIENSISTDDLNQACGWFWEKEEIEKYCKEDLHYRPYQNYIAGQLFAMANAMLLRRELQQRYPDHRVEYNAQNSPACNHWNLTRTWFVIDGKNAKDFDNEHNSTPICV